MTELAVSDYLRTNYEGYYEDGDSEWRRLGANDKVENIVKLCSDLPHDAILEIGAGEGSILQRMSELNFGRQLYALEISPSGVETIKKRKIDRLVECRSFDGYNIPYDNENFDLAILSHVVEHVEHPRKLLYEASRVAKHVFIEVPLEDTIRLPRDFTFDRVGHINFYSNKTIRRLVQSCNLRVLRQITTNPSKETYAYQNGIMGLRNYYIKKALLKVLPNVGTGIFVYHSSIVCKK